MRTIYTGFSYRAAAQHLLAAGVLVLGLLFTGLLLIDLPVVGSPGDSAKVSRSPRLRVQAQPRAQASPDLSMQLACPANRLANGGFEGGFRARGALETVVGLHWIPYGASTGQRPAPGFAPEVLADLAPGEWVPEGRYAQTITALRPLEGAGLWQRAPVPPGAPLRLSALARAWAGDTRALSASDRSRSDPPGAVLLRLGTDPFGGQNADSPSVRWTAPITLSDSWIPLAADIEAESRSLSVFLEARLLQNVPASTVHWDAICLQVPEEAEAAAQARARIAATAAAESAATLLEDQRIEIEDAEIRAPATSEGSVSSVARSTATPSLATPSLATIEVLLEASRRATAMVIDLRLRATERALGPEAPAGPPAGSLRLGMGGGAAVSGPSPQRYFDLDLDREARLSPTIWLYDRLGLGLLAALALIAGLRVGWVRRRRREQGRGRDAGARSRAGGAPSTEDGPASELGEEART